MEIPCGSYRYMYCTFQGYQNLLKSARVPLLADRTCNSLYKDITTNMFCAGYLEGGIDTCSGDSGGPLVCEMNGLYKHYISLHYRYEPSREKTNNVVSEQVRHKSGCTVTEAARSLKFRILDEEEV